MFSAYISLEEQCIESARSILYISPAQSMDSASVATIHLDVGDYTELENRYKKEGVSEDDIAKKLRRIPVSELLQWDKFPPVIGRRSVKIEDQPTEYFNEDAPLLPQLQKIAAKKSPSEHFRFLIVNGFGGNLGDNLIGTTALDHLLKLMRELFPSFSIDFLHSVTSNPFNAQLVSRAPEINHCLRGGVNLAGLASYDGVFEFSYLLTYPKYFELPTVDFYLWWFGLDPQSIAPELKRNSLRISHQALDHVRAILAEHSFSGGQKRVLFSHKASVPLRSVPAKQAKRLVSEMLSADENLVVVLDFALDLQHPRLWNLDGKINQPDYLLALMAQMDGLITVDSFALHVADALALPTVLLATSLPPSHYPYYPYMEGMLLPDAEKLPAWLKTKTKEDEWEKIEPEYSSAWQKMRGRDMVQKLRAKMDEAPSLREKFPKNLQICPPWQPPAFAKLETPAQGKPFVRWQREIMSAAAQVAEAKLQHFAQILAKQGGNAVYVAPANSRLPCQIAEILGTSGRMYVFEPRRLCAQTQATQFVLAGLDNLYLSDKLLDREAKTVQIDESNPHSTFKAWEAKGNSEVTVDVELSTLDTVPLDHAQMVMIAPPADLSGVLLGGLAFFARTQAWMLCAPVSLNQLSACSAFFQAREDYELFITSLDIEGEQLYAAIGKPKAKNATMDGFQKVNFE